MKDKLYRLIVRHDCMEYNTNDQFSLADDLVSIARDLETENKRLQKVILDSSGCFTKAQIEAILDDILDRG